jgi:DNA-binding PadR family transcriptional regulator
LGRVRLSLLSPESKKFASKSFSTEDFFLTAISAGDIVHYVRRYNLTRYIVAGYTERGETMALEEQGALTEAVFYILLALHQPLHGYGIMQGVQELTNNRVVLGPGTLYGALNTLVEKDWIKPLAESGDSRRKQYVITEQGELVFQQELARLEELVHHGKLVLRSADHEKDSD